MLIRHVYNPIPSVCVAAGALGKFSRVCMWTVYSWKTRKARFRLPFLSLVLPDTCTHSGSRVFVYGNAILGSVCVSISRGVWQLGMAFMVMQQCKP